MDINKESAELIKILAMNLEKWINSNNISKRKLARLSNISESTVRSIINGSQNIELATLVKLKLSFNVDISFLFTVNEKIPTIITTPLSKKIIDKAISKQTNLIGFRIASLMRSQNIKPEDLSILAFNTDYSDTLKYMKGMINLTLITILKFSRALNVDKSELLK